MKNLSSATAKSKIKRLLGRFVFWFFQKISDLVIEKDSRAIPSVPAIAQESRYLQDPLKEIVYDVVDILGYAGAMVATYETGDALPVRALYINPEIAKIATEEQIKIWEKQASQFTSEPISLTDPRIARVYPHQDEYQNNLSVIAFNSGKPEIKDNLFSLFTPIAPKESEGAINLIQELLGIKQVIAVPFFLGDDFVGNLFAATRSYTISNWEIDILKAFGQQTAAGLRNVRLYRKTEELYKKGEDRRKSAEIFGKMAFTASASVHALKNHMGVVKGNLQLLKLGFDEEIKDMTGDALNRMEEKRDMAGVAFKRANDAIALVNSLHEPWKIQNEEAGVNVNSCINRAAERALGVDVPWVKKKLAQNCPLVKTTPEMLTEAFKVLIKNANESMSDVSEDRRSLEIESRLADDDLEVVIQDHGSGIAPENISKIFEMRYTTKESGLGFGLFWTKDYIEGLGGSIDVESVVGVGTKFSVRLPVAKDITL